MSRPAARYKPRFPPRTQKCRSGAADDLAGETVCLQGVERLADGIDRGCDRLGALLVCRHVLRAAVIGLQPAEFEIRRVGDTAGEYGRILSRRNAAALHADLDLDEAAELYIEVLCHPGGCIDLLGRVEAERDRGITRERGKSAQLTIADDLIATRTSVTPPRTKASASPTFWTH